MLKDFIVAKVTHKSEYIRLKAVDGIDAINRIQGYYNRDLGQFVHEGEIVKTKETVEYHTINL